MTQQVSRQDFELHVANLARTYWRNKAKLDNRYKSIDLPPDFYETTEPCTLWLGEPTKDADGVGYGEACISFFLDKELGMPHMNDSSRGQRMNYFPPEINSENWQSLINVFDEEERIAQVNSRNIKWEIGSSADKFAVSKRFD